MKNVAQAAEDVREELDQVKRTLAAVVAERSGAEEKLRELVGQLDDVTSELESFAYSVSHDLRAPIRHIEGFALVLRATVRGDSSYVKAGCDPVELVDAICQSAQQCNRLIEGMLVYSRAGREELSFVHVDARLLVERAVAEFAEQIQCEKATIRYSELPEIVCDVSCINQVFVNLISNALKYRQAAPPEISISCVPSSDRFVFSVSDNGIGFDMAYASQLFHPFRRLHPATTHPGLGMGLAVCRRLIARHSGRIWAESKVDSGSTFYFSLPRGALTELLLGREEHRSSVRPNDQGSAD